MSFMEPSGTLAGLDILVVEDDDDTRFFITTVLEMDGAKVIAVIYISRCGTQSIVRIATRCFNF